jgi:hypothetical protein
MKKNKYKIILILIMYSFLQGCGTVKDAFSSQKKNSTDEFLVEKKSPLVMPPNFDELPLPKSDQVEKDEKIENSGSLEALINNSSRSQDSTIQESGSPNQSIENSIIDKIKSN